MRSYHNRVSLQSRLGEHLRRVPGELARAMVDAGSAEIVSANGRVHAIKLVETAATHATRIGEPIKPTGPTSVRFVRKLMLESGHVIWEHHRRALEQ